jgi:hypothetical protein
VQRAAWTTLFTAVLDAAMRSCRTPEERRFFQNAILERIAAYAQFQENSEGMMAEFLQRLRYEGNTHLLDAQDFASIEQNFARAMHHFKRHSHLSQGLFQIRQRYELAKLIYPESLRRRLAYRFRHLRDGRKAVLGWLARRPW